MEKSYTLEQEPRKFFLTKLIQRLDDAYETIFVLRYKSLGVERLLGILLMLDAKSKTQASPLIQKLHKNLANTNRETIYTLYDEVCSFLFEGYLKQLDLYRPPTKERGLSGLGQKLKELDIDIPK